MGTRMLSKDGKIVIWKRMTPFHEDLTPVILVLDDALAPFFPLS